VSWVFESEVRFIGDCVADGYFRDYGYTWAATDDCDYVTVLDVLFRIIDTIPPVLVGIPDDITVSCSEIPELPLVSVLDECQCFNLVFEEDIDNTIACMDQNKLYRTWIGYDFCGNSVSATQTITLIDDEGPFIVPVNSLITGVQDGDILFYDCNEGGIPAWLFELTASDVYAEDACSEIASVNIEYRVYETEKCAYYATKKSTVSVGSQKMPVAINRCLVSKFI
jgi:hypothetical protein